MITFVKRPGAILEAGSLIARLTLDDPNQCRTFALYSGKFWNQSHQNLVIASRLKKPHFLNTTRFGFKIQLVRMNVWGKEFLQPLYTQSTISFHATDFGLKKLSCSERIFLVVISKKIPEDRHLQSQTYDSKYIHPLNILAQAPVFRSSMMT